LFHQILVSGVSVEQFVIDLTEYYRGLLFIQSGIKRESLLGYAPERFLKEATTAYSRAQIERIVSLLLQVYRDIRYSVDARYELEVALSRMCRMRNFIEPADLYANFRKLEQAMRAGIPASQPEPASGASERNNPPMVGSTVPLPGADPERASAIAAPEAASVLRETMNNEHWQAIVESIRKTKPTLSSLLNQIVEWRQEADCLNLTLESRYAADSLRADTTSLLAASREIMPTIQRLDIRVQDKATAGHAPAMATSGNQQVERVREIFHGEIVRQGGQS
jgi:DNA polymerase-3 subunit gamma/tau